MRLLLRLIGVLLLLSGLGWAIWIVGGVLSHNPALATLGQLPGPLLFHTVCMVLGALCMTARPKAAAPAAERV